MYELNEVYTTKKTKGTVENMFSIPRYGVIKNSDLSLTRFLDHFFVQILVPTYNNYY